MFEAAIQYINRETTPTKPYIGTIILIIGFVWLILFLRNELKEKQQNE